MSLTLVKKSLLLKKGRIQDFPWGGIDQFGGGGRGPPTQVLFSENVCENKRIISRRGACAGKFCM